MSESSLPHTNGATKPPLGDDHQAGCQENGRQDANTEGTATSLSKLVVTLDQPPTDSRVPTTTAGALSPMDVGSHDIDDSGYISDESCNYDSAQEDFVPGDLVRKDLAREDSASEYFAPVIEPSIKILDRYHFHEEPSEGNSVHLIEVLQVLPDDGENTLPYSRRMQLPFGTFPDRAAAKPSRVRIRSARLTALLDLIAEKSCGMHRTWDLRKTEKLKDAAKTPGSTSVVYLYPFKLFVLFEQDIRRFAQWLRDERPEHPEFSQFPEVFWTPATLEELLILIDLFDFQLSSVFQRRRNLLGEGGFQDSSNAMIEFADLWLLYEPGQLVYMRQSADTSRSRSPPQLWQVLQYSGARKVLNNDSNMNLNDAYSDTAGAGSKDKMNRFVLKGFTYDTDEQSGTCVPIEQTLNIPHWSGFREIRSLFAFPVAFCRPNFEFPDASGEKYLERLSLEGQQMCELKQGMIKSYKGPGIDEYGTLWQYDSEVIIDSERARQDAPELFGNGRLGISTLGMLSPFSEGASTISHSISLEIGDTREVEEDYWPVVDDIHDDITMEWQYFKHVGDTKKLATVARELSSFDLKKDLRSLVILPRLVCGFVLSARTWANLDIGGLDNHRFKKELWDEVMLQDGHKHLLLAAVQKSAKIDTTKRLPIHGKGLGTLILLQGHPGTGKTFTAEALAARTERALYPITPGELGSEVAVLERNLDRIFQRGRRWDCILLMDEGDVYLTARSRQPDGTNDRNRVVGVFLRHLEDYPGIIIITTNWAEQLDRAVRDRVTLPLPYRPLNRNAITEIWKRYSLMADQFLGDRPKEQRPHVEIAENTREWAVKQYNLSTSTTSGTSKDTKDTKEPLGESPWTSGRQIRTAFRLAIFIAMQDRVRQKYHHLVIEEGKKPEKDRETIREPRLAEGDWITVEIRHFEQVFELFGAFAKGLKDGKKQPERDENISYDRQDLT
ncbi:hypothetical protein B0T12DRAFT_53378 [Alternaria alternata]|nr:hypothetical protein B0T12DRAFT_53378 [Alternaria alternata]